MAWRAVTVVKRHLLRQSGRERDTPPAAALHRPAVKPCPRSATSGVGMPRGRPRGSPMALQKPRGRMTAYAFFVQTCRSEHKKLHPDENVQFQEFSRQCSERWKTMSDTEKKKFHDMAEMDKDRYDRELKDYIPSPTDGAGRRGRRRRASKPKDPNKPKRALSAFFYYANEERAKVRAANPDFTVGEVAKELGRQWNELTESQKVKFEKQAEEDRARYDREMTIYKSGGPFKKMKASNGHPTVNHEDVNELEDSAEDDDDEGEDEEEDE